MLKLSLSFGRWNKLNNILDFFESSLKNSCIGDSTLRLKGCINDAFSYIFCGEVSQIQKTGIEWSVYVRHLREVSQNGLPYWLTGIFVFFKSYYEALQREKNQFNCILRHWSRSKSVFKIWEFILIASLIVFLLQWERCLRNTSKSVGRNFKWIPSCDLDEFSIVMASRLTLFS